MRREDFLKTFIEAVEFEENVTEETILDDMEEWDSLAAVTTLALFKKNLGLNIGAQYIKKCKTVKDILNLGVEQYGK